MRTTNIDLQRPSKKGPRHGGPGHTVGVFKSLGVGGSSRLVGPCLHSEIYTDFAMRPAPDLGRKDCGRPDAFLSPVIKIGPGFAGIDWVFSCHRVRRKPFSQVDQNIETN